LSTESKLIGFLLLVVSLNNLLWAAIIPFDGAPDEIHHFEVVQFIMNHRRLPVFGEGRDLYIRIDPNTRDGKVLGLYATQPNGAYVLGAIWGSLIPLGGRSEGYLGARLASVVAGTITVWLAYHIAKMLFPGKKQLVWGLPILVAFVPQVTYVSAYVNQDAFTMMVTSLVLWLWMLGMAKRWSWRSCIALGIALALAAVGRQNGWMVAFPLLPLVLALSLRGGVKEVLGRLVVVIVPPSCVVTWWFARNYSLYGDILASSVAGEAWLTWLSDLVPNWEPYVAKGYNFVSILTRSRWLELSFKSFWGVFGYWALFLDDLIYWLILVACLLGGLALIRRLVLTLLGRNLRPRSRQCQALTIFALAIAIITLASLYSSLYQDFQPQSRYLLPAIIPICTFLLLGWHELGMIFGVHRILLPVLSTGLVLLNYASLLLYIVPWGYG